MYGAAFFFLLLMEVNSCLTILSSDVFSRELKKQTTRGMQAEDYVAVATVPTCTSISLKKRNRQQHRSPVLCHDLLLSHLLEYSGREYFICLCTTLFIFAVYLNLVDLSLPALSPGWMKHTCGTSKKKKQQKFQRKMC